MKRVIVRNNAGAETHRGEFQDPTVWIAENVKANAWGLAERIENAAEGKYAREDVLETFPEQGKPGAEDYLPARVRLRAQYAFEIIDIDAEINATKQRAAGIATALAQLATLEKKPVLTNPEIQDAVKLLMRVIVG